MARLKDGFGNLCKCSQKVKKIDSCHHYTCTTLCDHRSVWISVLARKVIKS